MTIEPPALARSALRWDAAYCALLGAAAVVFAAPLGDHLGLAPWLVAPAGFGVVAWAGMVWGFARADLWWGPSATVGGVNLAAAVLVGAWAIATGGPGGALLGLIALQVLAFAGVQGVAVVAGWPRRVP
jgi:hypothetical protein